MGKKLAIIGLSAGLVGGGTAGLAFTGSTGIASAQTETTTTAPATSSSTAGAPTDRPDPSARLSETLAPLVTDGTITQAQADKVIEALKAAGPMGGGGHGRGGRGGGPGAEAAATALGMTADELRAELQGGTTIAAVATEKGVELSKVTDAMLAAEKEHLAADVTSGKITQAQADERLTGAADRITAVVNGERPTGGPGGGRDGGPDGGPGGQPPAAPADSTTTTTA